MNENKKTIIATITTSVYAQKCYQQVNDRVVIDASEADLSGTQWVKESNSGRTYIRWNGPNVHGSKPASQKDLIFKFTCTPGTTNIWLHTSRPDNGDRDDQQNDAYIRFNDGGYKKLYTQFGSGGGMWKYSTQFDANHVKSPPTFDCKSGDNMLYISGRSKNYMIDFVVLTKQGSGGLPDKLDSTPCSGGSPAVEAPSTAPPTTTPPTTTTPTEVVPPKPVETPEPVAPEPVAPEPVVPEPVAPEPATVEPVAPEPVAPEPVAPVTTPMPKPVEMNPSPVMEKPMTPPMEPMDKEPKMTEPIDMVPTPSTVPALPPFINEPEKEPEDVPMITSEVESIMKDPMMTTMEPYMSAEESPEESADETMADFLDTPVDNEMKEPMPMDTDMKEPMTMGNDMKEPMSMDNDMMKGDMMKGDKMHGEKKHGDNKYMKDEKKHMMKDGMYDNNKHMKDEKKHMNKDGMYGGKYDMPMINRITMPNEPSELKACNQVKVSFSYSASRKCTIRGVIRDSAGGLVATAMKNVKPGVGTVDLNLAITQRVIPGGQYYFEGSMNSNKYSADAAVTTHRVYAVRC